MYSYRDIPSNPKALDPKRSSPKPETPKPPNPKESVAFPRAFGEPRPEVYRWQPESSSFELHQALLGS